MMMFFGIIPIFVLIIGVTIIGSLRMQSSKRHSEETEGNVISNGRGLDRAIFRLAQSNGGHVNLSEVVIETGLDMKAAEAYMETLIDSSHVTMELTQAGSISYVFPELTANQISHSDTQGENDG